MKPCLNGLKKFFSDLESNLCESTSVNVIADVAMITPPRSDCFQMDSIALIRGFP